MAADDSQPCDAEVFIKTRERAKEHEYKINPEKIVSFLSNIHWWLTIICFNQGLMTF